MKKIVLVLSLLFTLTSFSNSDMKIKSNDSLHFYYLDEISNLDDSKTSINFLEFKYDVLDYFTNCVYIVEFQTAEGDVLLTVTYTYTADDCSTMYGVLRARAISTFHKLFGGIE